MALLYYITDRRQLSANGASLEALVDKVRAAFAAGVEYVQLREKDLEGGPLAALVERLGKIPEKRASRLLVNERLDVARACGADGLHLPADSLPLAAVRTLVGSGWIIGAACHSLEEVEQAAAGGADYALLAPVFATASKPGMTPLGLESLAAICRRSTIPIFALGGITAENARACLQAGAQGLAGIRLFQQAEDLPALCQFLHSL